MEAQQTPRPSVPSGLLPPDLGDGQETEQTEGAKNPWAKLGCHTKIHVATYNARTLLSKERLLEMEAALEKIRWDVVGVSEVRRRGEECLRLRSGHTLYYRGHENKSEGGVGLFINKKWTKHITHTQSVSVRVVYVCLKLNNKYSLKIIQAYAPTSTYTNEEVEEFYEDISRAIEENRTQYTMVIGDFNAKLGKREDEAEIAVGPYGFDERNERGEMLLNFLHQQNLFATNTFFPGKKQRKWTWMSPDGNTRNEIDYILSKNMNIVHNVTVLNSFTTGSDHRMVRAKVVINTKVARSVMVKKRAVTNVEMLMAQQEEFIDQMREDLSSGRSPSMSIDDLNHKIISSIRVFLEAKCSSVESVDTIFSRNTEALIERRHEMDREGMRGTEAYRDLNRLINRKCRADRRRYNVEQTAKIIEENRSMKVLRSKLAESKNIIFKLRDKRGVVKSNRAELLTIAEEFYKDLFTSIKSQPADEVVQPRPQIMNVGSEDMPDVTPDEVRAALKDTKNGKSPGEDGIPIEALKLGGDELVGAIAELFNKCLEKGKIPKDWTNAEIILLHKKGDITKLENYRPISLLQQIYKLFTKVITKRITTKLDFYQPVEQAGFRSGFSTNDHLQVIRSLIEKHTEYKIDIALAFVDYEKAFDSVEIWAILEALDKSRIDFRYSRIIKHIYEHATSSVRLHEKTNKFKLERGVRQGDTISPKLFTLALENIFKKLDWSNMGININGKFLNHLRFADDIVLIAPNMEQLEIMLTQLDAISSEIGLKMNLSKTKIMTDISTDRAVEIRNEAIELVESYKYLGHTIKLGLGNQTAEVTRRIGLGWAAFGKLCYVFKSKLNNSLKRKVFESCVLPVLTYGAETLTLTAKSANKLRVAQRHMERVMLGITLRDRMTNVWIRQQTKLTDVMERVSSLKWNWAGHIARMEDDRWTKLILDWRPPTTRPMGRPPERWTNSIKRVGGTKWQQAAMDREGWRSLGEAYIQQWRIEG